MDREQAKFILRSFRGCQVDSKDPDFAEALRLANSDLELGQWLAHERSFDAAFASALTDVPMPDPLRESILAHLAMDRGDLPQAEDGFDAAMIGALASLEPPVGLRMATLAAMDRTARFGRKPVKRRWQWLAIPAAAAAGVALAFLASLKPAAPPVAKITPVPVEVVQNDFIREFESPHFTLDQQRDDHKVLIDHLKERKLPCPGCLPRGLAKVKGVGCRELVIDGKIGSIICFDEPANGTVHLVIFRRQDVCGELPARDAPVFSNHGKWAVARWADDDRVFVLLGDQTDLRKLSELF